MNQINDDRRQLERTEQHKKRLRDFSAGIQPCSGDDRDALRTWLSQIDDLGRWTHAHDGLIIDLAGQRSLGALSKALLRARDGLTPPQRTWPNVKAAVSAQFLDADEPQFLQSRLNRCMQQPFEDVGTYTRRFQNQVDMAYTAEETDVPCVKNRLIALFIGGIKEASWRQQISVVRHLTLKTAQDAAADVERSYRVAELETRQPVQQDRQEEPMDISAVSSSLTNGVQVVIEKAVAKLEQKMGTMQGEIKSMKKCLPGGGIPANVAATSGVSLPPEGSSSAPQRAGPAPQQPPAWWYQPPPYWNQPAQAPPAARPPRSDAPAQPQAPPQPYAQPQMYRPRRRCFECGMEDHMVRDCPQRGQAIVAAVDAALNARMSNQGNA